MSEEAAEMLECRSVEMCCLQEPRVWGEPYRVITSVETKYELLWVGNDKGRYFLGWKMDI